MKLTEIESGSFYKRSDGYYDINIIGINEENQAIEVIIPKTMLTISSDFTSTGFTFNIGIYSTFENEKIEPLTVLIKDDGDKNGKNKTRRYTAGARAG